MTSKQNQTHVLTKLQSKDFRGGGGGKPKQKAKVSTQNVPKVTI